tara:strand:- start:778 stop:1038 length:261 start_codon:yes stop_codon:yes gene_type:complete
MSDEKKEESPAPPRKKVDIKPKGTDIKTTGTKFSDKYNPDGTLKKKEDEGEEKKEGDKKPPADAKAARKWAAKQAMAYQNSKAKKA